MVLRRLHPDEARQGRPAAGLPTLLRVAAVSRRGLAVAWLLLAGAVIAISAPRLDATTALLLLLAWMGGVVSRALVERRTPVRKAWPVAGEPRPPVYVPPPGRDPDCPKCATQNHGWPCAAHFVSGRRP